MRSEWKEVRLGDVIAFNPKESLPKGAIAKKIAMEQLKPFLREIAGYSIEAFSGGSKFRNGDTIMARITPCLENGKTAQVNVLDDDEVGFGSTEYIVLRNINGLTDKDYIFYLAISPGLREIAINSMVGSSGRQRVQQSVLEERTVCVPPLPVQRAIAATLSCLDDKIELNNKINANLEAQAQAFFKSWFVDFEPFQGGEFVDSELGMIPKGWRIGKFTEVANVLGGGTPKTDNPNYWNGNIPFFTPKDVNGMYTLATEKYLTNDGVGNCNSRLYPVNTVFITARGTVGKVALAGKEMAMNQSCYALRGKDGYGQLFVYGLSQRLVDSLRHKSSGAVFNAIVTRDFDSENIMIPDYESINQFENIVSPFYAAILQNAKQSRALAALRDALLPKLMSGEIEVPVGEKT